MGYYNSQNMKKIFVGGHTKKKPRNMFSNELFRLELYVLSSYKI